jgi:hypothetical protein
MLEEMRGEQRTPVIFDPHSSTLPKTGNFVKSEKKAKKR